MEAATTFLSRGRVLFTLLVFTAVNAALFLPALSWIVPDSLDITGVPTISHLQLSWTADQFSHNLAEWSGGACLESAEHCTWPTTDGVLDPAPVADGPAGFKRVTLALDYTFPLLYGLLAVALAAWMWRLFGWPRRWLGLAVGAGITAAACDMVENSLHLWLLRGIDTWAQAAAADFNGSLVAAASVLASIKCVLLIALVAVGVAGALQWGLKRVRAGTQSR